MGSPGAHGFGTDTVYWIIKKIKAMTVAFDQVANHAKQ